MNEHVKRLFFGLEVNAPWPETLPEGRVLDEAHRHMTLAFLGNVEIEQAVLEALPNYPFPFGACGNFDECLLLPKENHPRVVAWHATFFEYHDKLLQYQQEFTRFLQEKGHTLKGDFLPHLTVARKPFDSKQWLQSFSPIPFFLQGVHLYESLGNLQYKSLWHRDFLAPFNEIPHEADIAYHIHGTSMEQLHLHAKVALSFAFPPILQYFSNTFRNTIEEIVIDLNEMVMHADREIGCSFKAVSFSGDVTRDEYYHWEMIIDV